MRYLTKYLIISLTCFFAGIGTTIAQVNDNCANASNIAISNNGWDLGVFTSIQVDLTSATLQAGEYVHPNQIAQDKSVWYKFSIPTSRNIRITLQQPGPPYLLNSTDAGWTLFSTQNCLPVDTDVVDPPILNIEGYEHKCLKAGDYFIQVTGKLLASGPIFVQVEIQKSTATEILYDDPSSPPYNFGILSGTSGNVYYDVGCQSIFQGERLCPDSTYTKSTWQTFTTDNDVDYIRFEITEDPWNSALTGTRNFGYVLYEGNVILDSIADDGAGLNSIDTCKTLSFSNNGQWGVTFNPCELKPNTTYSIQLLFEHEYAQRIRMRMYEVGNVPTLAPDPTAIPASQQLGILALGADYFTSDYFSCNSLLSDNNCGGVLEDTVTFNGNYYDMGYWYTFETSQDANVILDVYNYFGCQPTIMYQLFEGDVMNDSCNLPLVANNNYDYTFKCLPAGKYSVRVLGRYNPSQGHTCSSSLGDGVRFRVRVNQVALQQFGLYTPTEFEDINGGAALTSGNTYNAATDYFDCRTTFMPGGDRCNSANNRAIYRVITINQDGILTVGGGVWNRFRYRLYLGDVSTLPIINDTISGLVDLAGCQSTYYPFKICVTPGTYTLVTFGDDADVTYGDDPWFHFDAFPATSYTDPNFPEIMPNLGAANSTITATPTRFNCDDNPNTILGYTPCNNSTKLVYREFYIDSASSIRFTNLETEYYNYEGAFYHRIFEGRISTGSLTGLWRDCFTNFSQSICDTIAVGWYTVVTYANGETFANNNYTSGLGQDIGDLTSFTITLNPAPTANYNTFATAEQVNGGTPITWAPNGPHTAQTPHNQVTYTLGTEYFVCTDDLSFPTGITACTAGHNRVSYRVFTLSKPSFTYIYNLNPSPYVYQSRLYDGDITSQSSPYTIVHDCITDEMRICLPAGTYTLVTFGTDASINRSLTPRIYLDSLGTSKFDHASKAYDFANVPNDNAVHWGNTADSPDALGRNPSNDFIFCSTGAVTTDPLNHCSVGQAPPGNALPSPTNPRQNLWYTFEVTGPGRVYVTLNTLTSGKTGNMPFSIYKATGVGDSTVAQGLTLVRSSTYYYCYNYRTIDFYRDPCSATGTDRYYIMVDKYSGYLPNVQLEVGIRFEQAPPTFVLYDHYSQANLINDNPTTTCIDPYIPDTLFSGTFTGCVGNLNCATKDATDQNTCGTRTIWYKFTVGSTGRIRINYDRPNSSTVYNANDIQLYKSVVTGDSTSGGLVRVPLSSVWANNNPDFNPGTNYNYGEGCMTPGEYYIMFTGCNYPTETVVPRIWLLPQWGDLCSDPAIIDVDSAGTYSENLNITCFSIGEAPGEDGTNMGCLGSPVGMKTAWFKIDLNDSTEKMDVDIEILENTDVTADKIKYRVAYGDCDGMTFDNCVSEGIFIILNLKCRPPLSTIWVQVIMPDYTTGDITLNTTITPVPDTNCVVIDPTRPRADFDFLTICLQDAVVFTNNSTSGDSMTYYWDFGDGFTSTIEDPIHTYMTADTFLVMLVADNGTLADTLYRQVIVNDKPNTYFTTDIIGGYVFAQDSITITNLSTGAISTATYYWDFCAGPSCGASIPSYVGINPPKVTYSTAGQKTICLTISNGYCDSTYCYSFTIYNDAIFAGGPYDGHAVAQVNDSCNITYQNIFVGGPYDGHSTMYLTDTCSKFVVNIYRGGPYDGHDNGYYTDSCSKFAVNIYRGGPYDGHDIAFMTDSCNTSGLNIFAGGPYDGHDDAYMTDTCNATFVNIFAGGPYDGHDAIVMYCDTIPIVPPDSTYCDTCLFAGGPYDGHGFAFYTDSCANTFVNIYSGGPYDGHDNGYLTDSCSKFVINIYAGGPYDGHDNGYYTDSCSKFIINVFAGGPYDGHDAAFLTDSCSDFIINIFAGGPYDGHAFDTLDYPPTQPFTVAGDTTCIGNSAVLVASAPTNWYLFDGTEYILVQSNDSILTTPVFSSPGIIDYYVDNPFGCEKIKAIAAAYDTLANPDFLATVFCENEVSSFTNQTIVPATSTPSLGGAGYDINSVGTTGLPPGVTQISFSSAQTLNFSKLYNGINDQNQGWVANNSGVSTEWVQWNYLNPKSVNRFYYYPRNNCCPENGPTELRLYYDDGSGWKLVKTIIPTYPSNDDYDSGLIIETGNIYANRWKLEVDVIEPNSPQWGEFQVFASDPTIGGTTFWDFGDGNTSTLQNPTHTYAAPGIYTVTLTVEVPGLLCPNIITMQVDVCSTTPLSNDLLTFNAKAIDGEKIVQCNWETILDDETKSFELKRSKDGSTFHNIAKIKGVDGLKEYAYVDSNAYIGTSYYKVVQIDKEGKKKSSTIACVVIKSDLFNSISLYPNPTFNTFTIDIESSYMQNGKEIGLTVFNILGQPVMNESMTLADGSNIKTFDLRDYDQGTYVICITGMGDPLYYKVVKLK